LTDFILIGHERVGSFALADTKLQSMSLVVDAYLDSIAGDFNKHELPRLWFINNLPQELMPSLTHSEVTSTDLEELIKLIVGMTQSGMDVTDLDNEVRRRAHLPLRTLEDIEAAEGVEEVDPDDVILNPQPVAV